MPINVLLFHDIVHLSTAFLTMGTSICFPFCALPAHYSPAQCAKSVAEI